MSNYLVIVRNRKNNVYYYHNMAIYPEPKTLDELGRLALREMAEKRYVRRELGVMHMRILDCKFHQLGAFAVRKSNRGGLEIECSS